MSQLLFPRQLHGYQLEDDYSSHGFKGRLVVNRNGAGDQIRYQGKMISRFRSNAKTLNLIYFEVGKFETFPVNRIKRVKFETDQN